MLPSPRPRSITLSGRIVARPRALVTAIALLLLVASGISIGAAPAIAGAPSGSVIDQSNESGTGLGFLEIAGALLEPAQTFTAGKSGVLTAVDVSFPIATSGVSTVDIMGTTTTGMPDGTVLTSGSIAADVTGVTTVPLSPAIPIISGHGYAIVLSSSSAIDPAAFQPANYAAGRFFEDIQGSWGEPRGSTLYFATYVDQSANSAPTLSGTPASAITSGQPYSYSYTVGGSPAPDVTVSAGSLPPGLSLSNAGVLSGTPTTGGSYSFTVQADNGVGTAATVDSEITIRTVPGAPTIGTVAMGDRQATVSFTAPSDNGGSTIISYTVTSSPQGFTGTGTRSPITVTGLTNGTAYTFTVTAMNGVGTGARSAPSTSVTPRTTPDVPTGLTATAQPGAVRLSWTAPDDGGSAITEYPIQVSTNNRTWEQADTPTGTSDIITGLTNGTLYYFRVGALNAAGESSSSSPVSATPRTVPGAPTAVTADPTDGTVTLSWTPPDDNGGATVQGYSVQYSRNGTDWSDGGSPTGSPSAISGLANGTAYQFRVAAVNPAGTGTYSDAIPATPRTAPDAPTNLATTESDGMVGLTWDTPASDGGAAITGYGIQYRESGTMTWLDGPSGASSPADVAALTDGTSYDFRVAASNAAGTGDWSDPVSAAPFLFAVAFDTADGHGVSGTLSAGDHVLVSGGDLPPGATITVDLHSTPSTLGTTTVGSNGAFRLDVTIPAGTASGSHRLVATISGAGVATNSASVGFTIASASLAFTGDSTPWLLVGLALAILFGVGALLISMMRRRERSEDGNGP